ncbi:MAG: phospho-N-acetylmuramoyl-pentapeptide-transferase, partial [Bacteroidales bacterium]
MLYYLFDYLDRAFDIPGAGVFQYISFRAGAAVITSLIITLLFGKRLINYLRIKQVGESVRDLGLEGQMQKKGTPTMGGLIILGAILIPTILLARLDNIYVQLMLFTTIWLGMIGFVDDYIKVFKKDKEGLAGRFKIIGQVFLGVVVGATMFFSEDITIREKINGGEVTESQSDQAGYGRTVPVYNKESVKSTKTTIPFVKNNELDYAVLITWLGDSAARYAWLVFIPIVILIITAVSNGANLTDTWISLPPAISTRVAASASWGRVTRQNRDTEAMDGRASPR